MATYDDIAAIELRRLAELEKQAAMHGPQTEPHVLVEIQDLRHKHGIAAGGRFVRPPGQRDQRIDYDLLVYNVSGMFRRILAIEERNTKEDELRPKRQLVLNLWLGGITAIVLLNMLFTLWFIHRLFGI